MANTNNTGNRKYAPSNPGSVSRFFEMTGDAARVRSLSSEQLAQIVNLGSPDKEWIEYLNREIARRRRITAIASEISYKAKPTIGGMS